MDIKKKLYLVKKEIWAKSIKEAIKKGGEIYEIILASDEHQDQNKNLEIKGFITKDE